MLLFAVVGLKNSDVYLVNALLFQIQLLSLGLILFGTRSTSGIDHLYLQEGLLSFYFLVFFFYNSASPDLEVSYVMRFAYLFCVMISMSLLVFNLVKILQQRLTLMRSQQKVHN